MMTVGGMWQIRKQDGYWRVYRRRITPDVYDEVGHYTTHPEALSAVESFLIDDPFNSLARRNH